MTSTLPNFSASSANPAGPCAFPFTALPGTAPAADGSITAGAPGPDGLPIEFATLLPASPASPAAMPQMPQLPVPVTVAPPRVAQLPVTVASPLDATAVVLPPTVPTELPAETGVTPATSFVIPGKVVSAAVHAVVPATTPSAVTAKENTPARPHGISRAEFEQAAAFVAALLQTLQPTTAPAATPSPETGTVTVEESETTLPEQTDATTTPLPTLAEQGTPWVQAHLVLPNDRAFPTSLPEQARPGFVAADAQTAESVATTPATLVLPNGRAFPGQAAEHAQPSLGVNRSTPERLPLQARPMLAEAPSVPSEPVPVSTLDTEIPAVAAPVAEMPLEAPTEGMAEVLTPEQPAPAFTVSDDGAIEFKLELPVAEQPAETVGFQPEVPTEAPMEVTAELELPGQAVVRVEVTVPAPLPEPRAFVDTPRPVIFAGRDSGEKSSRKSSVESLERNFVFTGDKQVKTASPQSGISVAKTESTMSAVPTEEIRHPRNAETFSVLPVRGDFQVVQSPAERITAAPTEPAGQNFAERAVATVTGLAEAQFSASMHKAGSVQLRLKFGGEDLSVRVELREGVVHTDFRTDSPALREAIAHEWQAVAAAAPGHLQRFLDPVFSPSSPTDAGSQQQSFHRQSQSQQQAHEQLASRQDAWSGQSPFSRRSALSESFIPEPSAPRGPVLLPTSLRLSVLA